MLQVVFQAIAGAVVAQQVGSAGPQPIVIRDVNVIDVAASRAVPRQTVVIQDGRIASITGPVSNDFAGYNVIDGRGKYLIPGLWDMHVHGFADSDLELYLANGVTGIRVMFGGTMYKRWRDSIASGTLVGPRVVTASPIIDGEKPIWPGSWACKNADDGRKAVARTQAEQYDFAKVYSLLSREAYFAIAEEAKKLGVPFEGHIPDSVTAQEASAAGQKSVEHLTRILPSCSSRYEEITKARDEIVRSSKPEELRAKLRPIGEALLESYDRVKAAQLFKMLRDNNTWQCPTLTVLHNIAHLDQGELAKDPRNAYMPKFLLNSWNPATDFRLRALVAEDYALLRKRLKKEFEIVRDMHKAGVPLLAGTDVMNPYCYPGFSLHDELGFFVKAGLSPAEALKTATLNPAKFWGISDLGQVKQGFVADLVLLDANPLEEIGATKKIRAVFLRGREINRKGIASILWKARSRSAVSGVSAAGYAPHVCDH